MRAYPIVALMCVICVGAVSAAAQVQAVPTFHCVGLYWSPEEGSAENVCHVRYRRAGEQPWKEAMPLWFDGREPQEALPAEHSRQYRGSIVNLSPGTQYEVELALEKTGQRTSVRVRTWSDEFPIAETVNVPERDAPLIVDKSGSPGGYTLYTHPGDRETTTIDVANRHAQCVEVRASYVILRGLTLRNAQEHGIRIFEGCHDIVIEGCDISGWGRISDDGWGRNLDSAVYSRAEDLARVIVQRNRMHHPRGDSNNWRENRPRPGKRESYHPEGPQCVYLANSQGNHVIRYNTVWSDDEHQYNDIFGAASNFSVRGFPNRDSDIYANLLSHCWDDAIESEGANCNVRIWGNYTTECFVSVACASTSVGPLYVWRNVSDVMRVAPNDWSGGFLKTSDKVSGGRIFVFHNTILQPLRTVDGKKISVGASLGLGWGGPMVNVTSRNNILHARSVAIRDRSGDPLADYDYDLYTGQVQAPDRHEKHGTKAEPRHVGGTGVKDGKGRFALRPESPGHDTALRLPNFNDSYTGQAPDIGAHEAGTPPMQFGVHAGTQEDDMGLPLLGRVKVRSAKEIRASNWSVGAETMDRDYTIYEHWKSYLGPLGFKKARLQAGWAKTERQKGVYDWAWLDAIIHDMVRQGVEPWMCLCYGNTLYAEGGGTLLGAQIPQTEEALQAWDRFVRAIVTRYKDAIDEWEVWNEPNHGKGNTPAIYAEFLIRTAATVRLVQPDARILAMSLAGVDSKFTDETLQVVASRGKLDLVDEVTYHPYTRNPDSSYESVARLREVIGGYSSRIIIRQGENGAPSEYRNTKALSKYEWTELSQAKWALRRLLGDLGRDIPSSYFSIMDMKYPDEMNRKGLLKSRDDQTVEYAKPAYYALQNLAAVFDDSLTRTPRFRWQTARPTKLSVFAYESRNNGRQVITIWLDAETPSDSSEKTPVNFVFPECGFDQPVYVDLREGKVYEIPQSHRQHVNMAWIFRDIPCYDSPILIADRSLIPVVRVEARE